MNLEFLTNIKSSIEELNNVERESSFVELELYQRASKELYKKKIESIQRFLIEESNYYKQNTKNHTEQINRVIQSYSEAIMKIIKAYEKFYMDIFKIRQNARDNQKTCVANIAVIEKKKEKCTDKRLLKKYSDMQIYFAQKKINYTVLINECTARILWCITHMEEDVLSTYNGSTSLTVVNKKISFWHKIRMWLYGKGFYKQFIEKIFDETLPKIMIDANGKAAVVAATEKGFLKQVKQMNKKIQAEKKDLAA